MTPITAKITDAAFMKESVICEASVPPMPIRLPASHLPIKPQINTQTTPMTKENICCKQMPTFCLSVPAPDVTRFGCNSPSDVFVPQWGQKALPSGIS